MTSPFVIDVALPAMRFESGPSFASPVARVWFASDAGERSRLEDAGHTTWTHEATWTDARPVRSERRRPASGHPPALEDDRPLVVIVHGLTADMRAGGPGGWWAPMIGPGRALDPARVRVVCVNNLGSCYGSSGPDDPDFPRRGEVIAPPLSAHASGGAAVPDDDPAPITPRDQAAFVRGALRALGLTRVDLLVGASIGGMIAATWARAWPDEVGHVAPVAASAHSTPWIQAYNHVGRQLLQLTDVPPERALSLARQLAHISYRGDEGLWARQGIAQVGVDEGASGGPWHPLAPWKVATYLEHQGTRLVERFTRRAYLSQLDAMDHHDARRAGPVAATGPSMTAVAIDSDALFFPRWSEAMVDEARAAGVDAELLTLHSPHGHDAFLIEWEQLDRILRTIGRRAGLP